MASLAMIREQGIDVQQYPEKCGRTVHADNGNWRMKYILNYLIKKNRRKF